LFSSLMPVDAPSRKRRRKKQKNLRANSQTRPRHHV
jgi:hypothetical protein